ncbi:MAG: SAM-dependent methyltransferase, partial [Aliifodinibius sp.]|nr:SAM-dependent methyltransferase [Fodinibius sp.]
MLKNNWMTPYGEVQIESDKPKLAYKIIQPQVLKFISYPYEWCFSQLKDAALLTLKIQKTALKFGMSLKDSSAYNIQFNLATGKPILIDTLSFEIYQPGHPWVAYRQFCQHFLGPLALMAYSDIRLNQLSRIY